MIKNRTSHLLELELRDDVILKLGSSQLSVGVFNNCRGIS